MASECYYLWRVYVNPKGQKKYVNEGLAPDGVCPSCTSTTIPADGYWNKSNATCQDGNIYKVVSDGLGGYRIGDLLVEDCLACAGDFFIGPGEITNYFT